MSVLKIKNSSNQWESVPTIKGDTGVGVESIEQTTTSTESGGTNIITATKKPLNFFIPFSFVFF